MPAKTLPFSQIEMSAAAMNESLVISPSLNQRLYMLMVS